jgi:hypothetical protein
MSPLCQFYEAPGPDHPLLTGTGQGGADEGVVFGCQEPQDEDPNGGPLFFLVPVTGGAVRVPVCRRHGDYLARLYEP